MNIKIGNLTIGEGRTFIICEIGNNHNGDFDRAIHMIDKAIETGTDCVKFQMRQIDHVYRKRSLKKSGEDLGTEYIIDLLKKFELRVDEHKKLSEYCNKKGILYLCTPWDNKSVEILESFGVQAYKVASADLTNLPLLEELSKTKKPLILSTGMNQTDEVKKVVEYLNIKKVSFILLHCNSTYPAPFHDINLKWMNGLRKIHPYIGYSGHERGTAVSIAAVALDACIIERHFTLDRNMEGPDHAASLEFSDFSNLVKGIREIEQALGNGTQRNVSQGEMINRENLGKSLVAAMPLKTGELIEPKHVKVLSPGQGLSPLFYENLLGRVVKKDMNEEDFFFKSDIEDTVLLPRQYQFKHPWGVPVRFHDFNKYHELIKPDFFEFHLSYSDMNLNIDDYLKNSYQCGFVVHAPELFQGSHLMDLATLNDEYRSISMLETQRVIDLTRRLKKFFPNEKKPMIVANIGGFSMDAPVSEEIKLLYYERFFKSLAELDTTGVEIIPQTMAPFPWHFGGQRYQNIFVKIDEIEFYCKKYQMRMCFDVSHSKLTCNYFNLDFYDFVKRIAPFTGHLHLGDAKELNGEGLQIGDGEIDFNKLGNLLNNGCPDATFLPEIWQGHKNNGEGFWIALEKLEGTL